MGSYFVCFKERKNSLEGLSFDSPKQKKKNVKYFKKNRWKSAFELKSNIWMFVNKKCSMI